MNFKCGARVPKIEGGKFIGHTPCNNKNLKYINNHATKSIMILCNICCWRYKITIGDLDEISELEAKLLIVTSNYIINKYI